MTSEEIDLMLLHEEMIDLLEYKLIHTRELMLLHKKESKSFHRAYVESDDLLQSYNRTFNETMESLLYHEKQAALRYEQQREDFEALSEETE